MIINKELEKYILNNSTPEDDILADLNRETHIKALNPRMISGHPQGKLLELISKIVSPLNILEIGTYTGYSAICLAKGLKPEGKLYTIERNDELLSFQKKYFKLSGFDDKIELINGDALEIIPKLKTNFDLIFIDADKYLYPKFYQLVIKKLNSGGVILADNVLWNGKVIEKNITNDKDTEAILLFNKIVSEDNRTENIILPIRDGISLIRKR